MLRSASYTASIKVHCYSLTVLLGCLYLNNYIEATVFKAVMFFGYFVLKVS